MRKRLNTQHVTISSRDRRGVVLVIMLVALLVLAFMALGIAKLMVARKRAILSLEASSKATWLASAGLERCFAQLVKDSNYKGETWTIEPLELGGRDGASIKIEVEIPAAGGLSRVVRSSATYAPASTTRSARRTRQTVYQIRPTSSGEKP